MNNLKYLFLLLFVIIILGSCTKNNTTSPPNTTDTIRPVIQTVLPQPAGISTTVTISGSGFGALRGSSYITINSTNIPDSCYQTWSANQIKFIVPVDAVSGKLTVTTGAFISNSVDFVVSVPAASDPLITSLTQTIAQPGQQTSIIGKNFGSIQGTSYVEVNGTKVILYSMWTDTKIIITIPENATTGNIFVFVNSKNSNGFPFTVQQPNYLLTMKLIPAGSFTMGYNASSNYDDKPEHTVTISGSFYMAETEITQLQWKKVMDNSNPSSISDTGDMKPVEQVTYQRALLFCNRLSARENRTPCYTINGDSVTCNFNANGYRLPTEAEWEYAARAGKTGEFSQNEILAMAWTADNSMLKIHNVASKQSNAWGLYDMLGNVSEMCWDYYDESYYTTKSVTDPHGPDMITPDKVLRGGTFQDDYTVASVSKRDTYQSTNDNYNYNRGFRVVRK